MSGVQVGVTAEDEDDADDLSMRRERDADAVQQPHAGGIGQFLQHAVEFDQVEFGGLFLGQERLEVTQESGGNAMRRHHPPAVGLFEGDNPRLPG